MIQTKEQLRFYLMADRMMNTGAFTPSLKQRIYEFLGGGTILRFLKHLRCAEYYQNHSKLLYIWHLLKVRSIGRRLGFSIGLNTLGYGVVISHYGTIVVGSPARLGNYCVLHTSTCISGNEKVIGDALYLGAGAKITRPVALGDNISVGANSLVNSDFMEGNVMVGGMPARVIKRALPWYVRDGKYYTDLHDKTEALRIRMGINNYER